MRLEQQALRRGQYYDSCGSCSEGWLGAAAPFVIHALLLETLAPCTLARSKQHRSCTCHIVLLQMRRLAATA
jgi:hypothetical protein